MTNPSSITVVKSGLTHEIADAVERHLSQPQHTSNLLATIKESFIGFEDNGCLTIMFTFKYEHGNSYQRSGGYNYGNSNRKPIAAFGDTIHALCKIYGGLDKVIGQKVAVIKDCNNYDSNIIGFRPLFLDEQHPDFIFTDFL